MEIVWGSCFDIISTHRCWWGCKLYGRYIWRYPSRAQIRNRRFLFRSVGHRKDSSLFLTSQRMPSRYVAYRCIYNYKNIIILWMWSWKFIYKFVHAVRSGDQFFCGWGRNLWFRNRTRKKVYRRQERKLEECVLIKIYCEYRCGNCLGFCFDILSAQRCW